MSKLEAIVTLEVKDKNDKIVSRETKPCKSFVLQFLQILEIQSFPSIGVSIKDVAAASVVRNEDSASFDSEGAVSETKGIMVGTGTTGVDNLDYVMETPIAHGVGAGQLSYGAMSKVTTAEVGANVDLQLIRAFSNTSGNTINVTEIGIYCMVAAAKFMSLHEIVALTAVANGQTLTVTITFRTTV